MASVNKTAGTTHDSSVCYSTIMISSQGIWAGDDPLQYSLPILFLQMFLVALTTKTLEFIIKPLRQPKVVAETLGGILLGPSCLGRSNWLQSKVFPLKSVEVMETIANVGLHYFIFLVGVEMDVTLIRATGKKSIWIALAGMGFPFIIGCFAAFILKVRFSQSVNEGAFLLLIAILLSVTAFPVLARILTEIKLLDTEIGRIAMASASINNIFSWIILTLAIGLARKERAALATFCVLLSTCLFPLLAWYAIRPVIRWVLRHTPEGEPVNDLYLCAMLMGVMGCGFLGDALGFHSLFGAFVYGLVIPNGPLRLTLIEKLDSVVGLLLPLFFALNGLRTNIFLLKDRATWAFLIVIILLACTAKVVSTMIVAFFFQMNFREGVTLGMLMNTKGLMEVIILNVGRKQLVSNSLDKRPARINLPPKQDADPRNANSGSCFIGTCPAVETVLGIMAGSGLVGPIEGPTKLGRALSIITVKFLNSGWI